MQSKVRASVQKATKLIAPEILGLKKEYQGEDGTAPKFLLQSLFDLEHPFGLRMSASSQRHHKNWG